jgi:sec-independent protein translocase protein TatC
MAGALDEDTARTLASGRQTIGSVLSNAQDNLKRVFLVFVAGWLLTFMLLRWFIWDRLKTDLVFNRLPEDTPTQIVATDPFQVILLQVKIGLIVGGIVALPVLIYLSRDALEQRGLWPDERIPLWKKVSFAAAIGALFLVGLSYAYFAFFPIMFEFLAENAIQAEFTPTWSIVLWTEFVVFLSLSFGVAAQLPLAMSASARTGVVRYETFRDKWRYAVVGIFVFGAMFSPPDPFTQIMWGVPLVLLYFLSLGVAKLAVLSKRASESVPVRDVARDRWNALAAVAVLAFGLVYVYSFRGGAGATNDLLAAVGSEYRVVPGPELDVLGLDPTLVVGTAGVVVAAVVAAVALFYVRVQELEQVVREQSERPAAPAGAQSSADPGEEAEIDVAGMSGRAVEAAPPEAFMSLDEDEALGFAQQAVDNENPAKAQAILDKFDEAQELEAEGESEDEETEEEDSNVVTSTAAGIVDPFTEDETTEDDIGGYYYDLRFILGSLTSKAFWIVGVFMLVLAGSFAIMFRGGLGVATDFFFQNMPADAVGDPNIVVLHPVEALIFMLKFSTVLAALAVLPLVVYFAWPAIEQRFNTDGDRSVLLVWGGTMVVALVGGTALGFVYIAPSVISLLALDVVNANMVIAYRISSFGWLVIFLTVGIGALAMIPATMVLFQHGNIVSYARMRTSWRGVVLAIFAAAGLLSPNGLFTMFIVAIPASLAYGAGLGLTWIYERLGGRDPSVYGETAD